MQGNIKSQYPSLIGNSSVGPNPTGNTPDSSRGFSPETAEYLTGRNIPLDRAAKLQKLMSDGEPITVANYKGAGNA